MFSRRSFSGRRKTRYFETTIIIIIIIVIIGSRTRTARLTRFHAIFVPNSRRHRSYLEDDSVRECRTHERTCLRAAVILRTEDERRTV